MATLYDGISQQLDFTSCGEEGSSSSSDNSSDDYTSRIRSPRIRSPRICSPRIQSPRIRSPSSACRTPRVQRHRSRSSTLSSPVECTSPIPYASWKKLRLCDSPSTPKVGNNSDWLYLSGASPCALWVTVSMSKQFNFMNCISIYFSPAELTVKVVPALLQH